MSPRPVKPRRCRCPYGRNAFKPTRIPMDRLEKIPLAKDELETLRLCDLLGLTQEDAGRRMRVSRGTVQRLVTRAREKVARALIERCALVMAEKERKS
ncbi:MAG: DNA-binding protein [Elusimicrobia bacterium GWA2_69_24]|nr:MAG: DNA-binding protein [Elusimicrobia bacterium GWA2_69_24]HBL18761.1 DNA-binding protein [Elusimicrobiota bacterium]